jgi:hypothetical protein
MVKDVTMFDMIEERRGSQADREDDQDLYPYLAELLENTPQITLDFLTEDLRTYEETGYASATISRLLARARCLAEADRIESKFAA